MGAANQRARPLPHGERLDGRYDIVVALVSDHTTMAQRLASVE